MAAVYPLPLRGELVFDARGAGRAMRVSWHPERDVVILSVWRGTTCAATIQVAADELPHLVDVLVRGLPADCSDGPVDCSHPGRVRHRRPGRPRAVLGRGAAPRGYAVPAPPGGFPDWPAFLAAHGVPGEHWNDASALEAEGQPRLFFQRVPEPQGRQEPGARRPGRRLRPRPP